MSILSKLDNFPNPTLSFSALIHHPVLICLFIYVYSSMGNMLQAISMYLISSVLRIVVLETLRVFGEKQTHPKKVYRSVPGHALCRLPGLLRGQK